MARSLAEEVTRPLVLISISALLGLLFYFYYRFVHSPYQVFAGTGVKGPRPRFLLGSALEYSRLGELQMYSKLYQTYGPVFGLYMGTNPVLVVADTALMDVVLTADHHTFTPPQQHFLASTLSAHGLPVVRPGLPADDGQTARKTLSSILLLPKLLKLMMPIVLRNFDSQLCISLEACADVPSIDIWNIYQPYCLQVILGVVDFSSSAQVSAAATAYFNAINRHRSSDLILRSVFGSVPCVEYALKTFSHRVRAESEFNTLVGVVSAAVDEARRQHHQQPGIKRNYLQVLLDRSLTDDQVVSHCLLILVVGHHTVSSCLSYTTYQLAGHPLEQQRLLSEISGSFKREAHFYETVNSLEYLDAVVQESLRLHCLTPKLSRVCVRECGVTGATIRPGTRVEIPLDFIHHLHSHWDSPHSFSPDRFTTLPPQLNKKANNKTNKKASCPAASNQVYLPFGQGTHGCLGQRFAVMCVKLTLTEVIQRFKFSRSPDSQVPVKKPVLTSSTVVGRPARGMLITVTMRHKVKRQMSFASVVKTAMGRQASEDIDSP